MQLRHLLAAAAAAILVVVPCTSSTHAATDTLVASQSSATAAPPPPYPPSGTFAVSRKANGSGSGSVAPDFGVGYTVSCAWEDWPVTVNGHNVWERVDLTCTGLVAYQSVVLTVVHCDAILWGCLWNDHPEYGQPTGQLLGPGTATANGSWYLPSSGNGYFIRAHYHTCDIYDDCADQDGGSPQFFIR